MDCIHAQSPLHFKIKLSSLSLSLFGENVKQDVKFQLCFCVFLFCSILLTVISTKLTISLWIYPVDRFCCHKCQSSDKTTKIATSGRHPGTEGAYSVSKKILPAVFRHFFPKRLGIFYKFFTHLLCVTTYARLQIFIQLFPTLTKLCHTKLDHLSNFLHFTRS